MSSPRRDLQLASLGTLAFGFLTGKVIALTLGVEGVGYQSAVVGAGSLAALLSTFAIGNVLPELATSRPNSTAADLGRAFWRAFGLAALPAVGLAVLLTAPELSKSFDPSLVVLSIAVAAVGSALLAYQAVALSVFASGSAAARFQLVSAAVTSGTIVAAIFLAPQLGLPIAVGAGVLLGPLVGAVFTRPLLRPSGDGDPLAARLLIRHSLPTYGSSLLSAGAAAVAPLVMLNLGGAEPTGLFRAVSSLGGLPAAVVIPAIALHFYPHASRLIAAGEDVGSVTLESVSNLAGKAALGAVVLAVAAPLALWAAYSSAFVGAAAALAVMACAGGIRTIALHGAYLLLASGRRGTYFAAETVAAAVLLLGVVVAGWYGSVVGAAAATWVSAVAYLVFLKLALTRSPGTGHRVRLPIPTRLVVTHLFAIVVAATWGVLSANGVLG